MSPQLRQLSLGVFVAGLGVALLAAGLLVGRRSELVPITVKGVLLLATAAALALAAWCLRGHDRPAWLLHWVSLLIAASTLWGNLYLLGGERGYVYARFSVLRDGQLAPYRSVSPVMASRSAEA